MYRLVLAIVFSHIRIYMCYYPVTCSFPPRRVPPKDSASLQSVNITSLVSVALSLSHCLLFTICDRLQENRAQHGTLRKIFFCTYRVVGVQILSSPSFIVVA